MKRVNLHPINNEQTKNCFVEGFEIQKTTESSTVTTGYIKTNTPLSILGVTIREPYTEEGQAHPTDSLEKVVSKSLLVQVGDNTPYVVETFTKFDKIDKNPYHRNGILSDEIELEIPVKGSDKSETVSMHYRIVLDSGEVCFTTRTQEGSTLKVLGLELVVCLTNLN